jgi:DNA repair protein RecN (Recombination protein N)
VRATTRCEYAASAQALSAARAQVAARLEVEIRTRLQELGLPHARFAAEVSSQFEQTPQAHGQDRVEFLLATNPEQPLAPLNKVASGGELSRAGLALHAASSTRVPVVVYDEVDTGIGGVTANIVGRTLRQVASHCQVICITHSPQVASAGDHHLMVTKGVRDGATETELVVLTGATREREIARMLGAAQATKASVAHARDLLAEARNG